MKKVRLYIMVGLSASGKSTASKAISKYENCKIVSSDAIRGEICEGGVSDQSRNGEVFNIFHKRIVEALKDGKSVIADATNITIKARRAILEAVKSIDCEKIAYITLKSVERCIADDVNREYPVTEEVILKQVKQFQIPFYEEGFDEIVLHGADNHEAESIGNVMREMLKAMNGFNQHNPHHTHDLKTHCVKVFKEFMKKSVNTDPKYFVAAYIHDIGKLYTQTFDDAGIAHYYGHANVGAYHVLNKFAGMCEVEKLLDMTFLINYHMEPFNWTSEKARTKYEKIFGTEKFNLLMAFNECDSSAK